MTKFRILVLLGLLHCAGVPSALADIKPEQLAVLANKNSKEGTELAKRYLSLRGIPENRLIELDVPEEDTISREIYDRGVIAPVRKALQQRGIAAEVRAIVLMFGMPLRVAAPEANGDDKQALLEALSFREKMRQELLQVAKESSAFVGAEALTEQLAKLEDEPLVKRVQEMLSEAVNSLPKISDAVKNREARGKLNSLIVRFSGIAGAAQSLKVADGPEHQAAREALAKLQHDVQTAQRVLQALDQVRTPENRKRAYALASQAFGATGVLGRSKAYRQLFEYKEADASVDSELAFVWWDRDQYLVSERIPNPFHHRFSSGNKPFPLLLPVLLTARIDGPTVDAAARIIEQSIAAEKSGLSGKAYIDSRGLKNDNTSFSTFDKSLRALAETLDDETDYDVEHEETEKRFSEPGEAPDVALYAGWYRVRQYEDAFSFRPGAIGVHIASEEAVSLHDPGETGWCINALRRGITATMGAVGEPYLDSFPLPAEFFGLLLTGEYSLLEAYALTGGYVSWRMVLVGDPLYRPFAKKFVTAEELKDATGKDSLNPLPASPFDREFADPVAARERIAAQRVTLIKEIDGFYAALAEKMNQQKGKKPAGK